MSFVNLVLELTGNFHEGDLSFHYGYVYVALVRNLSQMWALYCLVLFYHATAEPLAPIRPFPKFLAIKLVVFATFWQAIAIDVAEEMHWVDINFWRFMEGTCVPNPGGEAGEHGRRFLAEAVHGKPPHEGAVPGEFEGMVGLEDGWNMTERGCTENGWLWSHPTEDVCFGGSNDECEQHGVPNSAVCRDKLCYGLTTEEQFLEVRFNSI